ncbi:MAG: hypothetical protein KA247_10745 [Bacteroidetes bacterium]|nr:hypothetical protein [Bacteroidota bacterium]
MDIFHAHYEYLKNEAEILLKLALNLDPEAIVRFHRLEQFSALTAVETTAVEELQLKNALHVIAIENGYASWNELKTALDSAAETSPFAVINDQFYPKGFTTYWNIWFAKYSQAKKVLQDGGGFLLPFKNQYFIVEEHFVDSIGLPHTLPEWKSIGNDWVHPKHAKAWLKLNAMYEDAVKARR